MKHEAKIKELLVNNAIHLIAEGGFEKATTKELAYCGGALPGFKMNEVYIYRFFGSKNNLYEAAFVVLDKELYAAFCNAVKAIGGFEDNPKEKFFKFFSEAWRFILGNEERFRYYVRYYYSIYYTSSSVNAHKKLFASIETEVTPLFKEEADVHSILHSVFIALLDFAIRVYNKDLEDNEKNRPHIFNVLYCMMASYLKDNIREQAHTSQLI